MNNVSSDVELYKKKGKQYEPHERPFQELKQNREKHTMSERETKKKNNEKIVCI